MDSFCCHVNSRRTKRGGTVENFTSTRNNAGKEETSSLPPLTAQPRGMRVCLVAFLPRVYNS